jgi:outer membrane protein TolC
MGRAADSSIGVMAAWPGTVAALLLSPLGFAWAQQAAHVVPDKLDGIDVQLREGRPPLHTRRHETGQASQVGTLDSAVALAFRRDPRVHEANWARARTENERILSWRGHAPQVSFDANSGNRDTASQILGRTVNSGGKEANSGLTMNWRIFDSFVTSQQISAASRRNDAAGLRYQRAQDIAALDAVTSYMDLYRLRQLMQINQENRTIHRRIAKVVQDRVKSKLAPETRLNESVLRLRDLEQEREDLLLQTREAEENYAIVTGEYPSQALQTPRGALLPIDVNESDVESLVGQAIDANPDIQALRRDIEAADHEVSAARNQHGPAVNLYASKRSATNDPSRGQYEETRSGVTVTWQLLGNLVEQQRGAALARREEAQARYERATREVAKNVRIASENLIAMRARLSQLKLNAEVARDAARQREDVFKVQSMGDDGVLGLSNAYNTAFRNEATFLNVTLREKLAQFNLLSAMGRLREDFEVSVSPTDTEHHGYEKATTDLEVKRRENMRITRDGDKHEQKTYGIPPRRMGDEPRGADVTPVKSEPAKIAAPAAQAEPVAPAPAVQAEPVAPAPAVQAESVAPAPAVQAEPAAEADKTPTAVK